MVSFVPNGLLATSFALLVLAVGACAPQAGMPAPAPAEQGEVKGVRGLGIVDVEAGDFYFRPRSLSGEPGQRLTLRIRNESSRQHNFQIQGQQIDQDIPPNETVEVAVTLPESGSLEFACKYHTGQDMTGQLLVGEASPDGNSGGGQPRQQPMPDY